MTDRMFIAVVLALVVESSHWLKLRWDFDETVAERVWKFTFLLITFAMVLIVLDGSPFYALPTLLTWMPPLLLPMQFVQNFGVNSSMPLSVFSFLAKRRRERNARLGLPDTTPHINFGNVTFVMALIGSALQARGQASTLFLPGAIILTGWMLLGNSRTRPAALVFALLFAGLLALAGQFGLRQLYDHFNGRGRGNYYARFDPDTVSTMIGKIARVNLSPEIVWRLRTTPGTQAPRLLRTASYNTYRIGRWSTEPALATEFLDLGTRLSEGVSYYIAAPDPTEEQQLRAVDSALPVFRLRGAAAAETPLALPGDTASLREAELDGIERNSFGTIRVFPKQSVIETVVLWKGDSDPDSPPITGWEEAQEQSPPANGPLILGEDLKVPAYDVPALQQALKEAGLDEATINSIPEAERPNLNARLDILRAWFFRNFRYSRTLTISGSPINQRSAPSAMTQFLTSNRSGHCEYFASAAVLMLRESGIPARYSTGYALTEFDSSRREYVIRGTHGHAWARVWDESKKRWIDFDTTPPSWEESATPEPTLGRRFNDWLKKIREDFFLWRNRPANRLGATIAMTTIALGVLTFVSTRLWKSRRRMDSARSSGFEGPAVRTPLNALESLVAKRLGPRPQGMPLGKWLFGLQREIPEQGILEEAILLHQRMRFDPSPATPADQERLANLAKKIESAIRSVK